MRRTRCRASSAELLPSYCTARLVYTTPRRPPSACGHDSCFTLIQLVLLSTQKRYNLVLVSLRPKEKDILNLYQWYCNVMTFLG